MQTFNSSLFSWDSNTRTFYGIYSMLSGCLQFIDASSLEIGFAMRSVKTGHYAFFTLVDSALIEPGEYYSWTFVPTTLSLLANPSLSDVSVIVYNE